MVLEEHLQQQELQILEEVEAELDMVDIKEVEPQQPAAQESLLFATQG